MEPVLLADKRIIGCQLGRQPRGLVGIARRCVYGYPQVAIVYPIINGKPFPTLYWLTCPFLQQKVAALEAKGIIGYLEQKIATDQKLAQQQALAHRAYMKERNSLLSQDDLEYLESHNMLLPLLERGIGGIADFSKIKCLHLHVAHALARHNPIGMIVLDELDQLDCPPQRIICSACKQTEQIL
jgi:hypothetical protein